MATTAGAISLVSKTKNSASLLSAAATGGTGPYTYQWHRSLTSGFSPSGGTAIAGATSLTLDDTGLAPGTQYYYKMVATDSGAVSGTSSQLSVLTDASTQPQQNSFAMAPILGQADQLYNVNTTPCQVDLSETGSLVAGQAVKIVDSAGGVPKVVACTSNTDVVFGFIAYNIKNQAYVAGMAVEVFQDLNVIYLVAQTAIARGARCCLAVETVGGVKATGGSSTVVGYAFDKATNVGDLIRVKLSTPSFTTA